MFSIDWEKITYANVTNTIRTFVTIVGVFIAYKSYKKYIKNKLLEKQLEQVIKMIEKIKQCKFSFYFHLSEEQIKKQDIEKEISKAVYQFNITKNNIEFQVFKQETNLFEIALLPHNRILFKDFQISDTANKQLKELEYFCYDPLVPKSIANQLNPFLISDEIFVLGKMQAPQISNNYVLIGSPGHEDELLTPSHISYFSSKEKETAFKSWQHFIKSTKYLTKSIKSWMKNNGVQEINL